MNPHLPTKSEKQHFEILSPVYNSLQRQSQEAAIRADAFIADTKTAAGLPDSIVRGQLASSFHLSATQAITFSDEGKLSKANSLSSDQHLKSGQ